MIYQNRFKTFFKKKFNKYNLSTLILLCLLIIFIFLSIFMQKNYISINFDGFDHGFKGWHFLETLQVFFLTLTLLISIYKKNFIQKKYKVSGFYLRIFFISFLIYEELSWLTQNLADFNWLNRQGELNFHNIPIIANYWPIFYGIPLIIICFGNFFKLPKTIAGIILEKEYSFFGFIFIIERISYWSLYFLGFINRSIYIHLIHTELIELYIYIVLFFDLIQKIYPENTNKKFITK